MSLEHMYYEAQGRGNWESAVRIRRVMERLDDQRRAYGHCQRGAA